MRFPWVGGLPFAVILGITNAFSVRFVNQGARGSKDIGTGTMEKKGPELQREFDYVFKEMKATTPEEKEYQESQFLRFAKYLSYGNLERGYRVCRIKNLMKRCAVLLAAIVFALFIPFLWNGSEYFVIAIVCGAAAYGIGRLAIWVIDGFYRY